MGKRLLHKTISFAAVVFIATSLLPSFAYTNYSISVVKQDSIPEVDLTQLKQVKLSGEIISGKMISINYETLEGNNPVKNKNWLGIWQGSQIHYQEKPLRKMLIPNTSQDGDVVFDSLQISNLKYIVGFGSNDSIHHASASLFFSKEAKKGAPFSSSLKILSYGSNYIIINFNTPLGNTPLNHKNWIGLWKGQNIPSDCKNYLSKKEVDGNTASGNLAINNIVLVRNQWYTVGYSTGYDCSSIIATYSFQSR